MAPKKKQILVINGPNLDMLGTREPSVYGKTTLADIEAECARRAEGHGMGCRCMQSNHEGEIIDALHGAAGGSAAGVVINAAALTHTSVAIRDAVSMLDMPVVEVHISNIHAREDFRHHSYIAGVATGVVAGFGVHSYAMAIDAVARELEKVS